MARPRCPSRPILTDDLIRRLRSSETDPKEKKALDALSKEMIKVFQDERRLSYLPEAAALAPVTTDSSYRELFRAFINAMIKGTADGNILEPQLLKGFTFVLRCAEGTKKAELNLGPVMRTLQTRLKSAVEEAEPNIQYQLICTLSSVLDAMIDVKTKGLSREELHEPLLKQLAKLSKAQELRLAQAAGYAYQALLGIPDDEGPYKALLRHTLTVVEGATKVASAVSTMDPAKLFDSLTKLQDLPDLISSMVDVVKDLSSLISSLASAVDSIKLLQKQKSWYVALRFTDMLIQAEALLHLQSFVQKVPCGREKEFLCGTFAQLEQAWEAGIPSAREKIAKFLQEHLIPIGSASDHWRVQEWVKLIADTLGRSDWKDAIQRARPFWRREKKEYASVIPCRKMRNEGIPADLLEQAWLRCVDAHVFYADIRIREYYLQDERRLMVERLSGKPLSMDQCYINLAIIEHSDGPTKPSGEGHTSHQSSPFSLLTRLRVETPQKDAQVDLQSLFDLRERRDGTVAPPERILIRGQAGVGKTTLCKRIVYDFLHEDMWAGLFDRLLWVPLRTLKGRSTPEYSITQWLRDEYFRELPDRDVMAESLGQAFRNSTKHGKTLFILDGLDEMSRRDLDTDRPGLLRDLLKQSYVIITTRPSGLSLIHLNPHHLELETVGFYPDQVKDYIRMAAPDQAACDIQSFVQDHWLVQGLVRIPIQLEALCYSWDTRTANRRGVPTTMTSLYQAIERKLWKKDAARLGKCTPDEAKSAVDNEITLLVKSEIRLLEGLAFTGLCNDIIEFDGAYLNEIWNPENEVLEPPLTEKIRSDNLADFSFLRSSDTSLDEGNRSYHFLHLTFQEFFAARYFVERWKSKKPLSCMALGSSGNTEHISTEKFLRKEKYKARYDIFWRFVAGLLEANRDEEQLCRFFATIEEEPYDLLGPTHQRLIMHCLSEIVPSKEMPKFTARRANLEEQLSGWILFECSFRESSRLVGEMELPDEVLENVLQKGSEKVKTKIVESLRIRPKIPIVIMEMAIVWLRDHARQGLVIAVLYMLSRPYEVLPKEILNAIVARLEDQDGLVRRAAAEALGRQSVLSEEILNAIVARLEDQDGLVRRAAAEALGRQSVLSEEILNAIVARLEHQDGHVRRAAAEALGRQSVLSEEILNAIVARLEHQDRLVRWAAAEALGRQSVLSEEILNAIVARLEHQDGDVRWAAAKALGRQSVLSEEILNAIVARLEHQDKLVRRAAAKALGRQSVLSEEILNAIVARLEDQDKLVRRAAAEALGRQSVLSEEILNAIVARLEDQDGHVRWAAAEALGRQSVLSEEILNAIVARLEDQDGDVRWAAAEALGRQSVLSEEILNAIVARLEHQDKLVRWAAAEALGRQSVLSEEILNAIVARLEHQDGDVRRAAAEALGRQSVLSEEILNAIVARLEDQDGHVRRAAAEALGRQSVLSEEILNAIVARLEHQDGHVRRAAAKALGRQSVLSEEILSRYAKSLYRIWLERSFGESLSWYITDEISYTDTPEGFKLVRFESRQDQFMEAIQETRRALGVPLCNA